MKNKPEAVNFAQMEADTEPIDFAQMEADTEPIEAGQPKQPKQRTVTFGHTQTTAPLREDNAMWLTSANDPSIKRKGWYFRDPASGAFHPAPDVVGGEDSQANVPLWKKALGAFGASPIGIIAGAVDPEIRKWQMTQAKGLGQGIGKGFSGLGKAAVEVAKVSPTGMAVKALAPDTLAQFESDIASGKQQIAQGYQKMTGYKPGSAPVMEFAGEQIPAAMLTAGIGAPAGAFVKGAKTLGGAVGRAAAVGAGEGALQGVLAPTANEFSGKDYWKTKAVDAAIGAGLGGALGGVTGGLARGGRRSAELQKAAKDAGVEFNPLLGDAIPELRPFEEALATVPGAGMKGGVKTRQNQLGSYLMDREAARSATESGSNIQESVKDLLTTREKEIGKSYEAVKAAAKKYGVRVQLVPEYTVGAKAAEKGIAQPKVLNKLDELIKAESKVDVEGSNVRELVKLRNSLKSKLEQPEGVPFADLVEIERRVKSEAYNMKPGELVANKYHQKNMTDVAKALRDDIDNALTVAGDIEQTATIRKMWKDASSAPLKTKDLRFVKRAILQDPEGELAKEITKYKKVWGEANEAWKQDVVAMKERGSLGRKILDTKVGNEGSVADLIFTPRAKGQKSEAAMAQVKHLLNDDGKAAVKAEYWRRIQEAAKPTSGEGHNFVKAAQTMEQHLEMMKELFPEDAKQLDGMTKLYKAVGGRYGVSSDDKGIMKTISRITGIGALATGWQAVPVAWTYAALSRSSGGRKLLTSLGNAKNPGQIRAAIGRAAMQGKGKLTEEDKEQLKPFTTPGYEYGKKGLKKLGDYMKDGE